MKVSPAGIDSDGLEVAAPIPAPQDSPATNACRIPLSDFLSLVGIATIYVTVLTYLGLLRFENFFTTNWDLGINQQLLWTTAHGRLLYETGDVEFFGIKSFLQLHSAYIALLVAPLYAAAPYPTTLFALQAGVFVASTVPIYLLARRAINSRLLIFLVIGLYLTSFPVLSALLYDFHWEAFIPLSYLSFFYLFRTRRYAWSVIPLVAGNLTLEVFPFLAGGVAVLVLFEHVQKNGFQWRRFLRDRDVRISILLLAAMLIVYVGLRVIEFQVIPPLVGSGGSPGTLSRGISGPFAFGATIASLNLSAAYWLLLLGALAFLPILAPRYLILTIPWFVYSVFLAPIFSSNFGDQYALIAVSTLSVALVYGAAFVERIGFQSRVGIATIGILSASSLAVLAAASKWSRDLLSGTAGYGLYLLTAIPIVALVVTLCFVLREERRPLGDSFRPRRGRWRSPRPLTAVLGGTVAVFIAFNIVMSPLNMTNYSATPYPGYWLRYDANPSSEQMAWVTSWIPDNAVVLTSDFLFTYVANNPNAWAVPWFPVEPGMPPLDFPFSGTDLPRFVLVDAADWYNFPTSVTDQLLNTSTYGLVAYVFSQDYPGTIYLFQQGYTGPAAARYVATPPSSYYFSSTNLAIGSSGRVVDSPVGKYGAVIESVEVTNPTGGRSCIWFGPYMSLLPGTYTVTANMSGSLLPGGNAAQPILFMDGGSFLSPPSSPLYTVPVFASELNGSGWTELSWRMVVPVPYPQLEFRGYLDYSGREANGQVTLNYIEVSG